MRRWDSTVSKRFVRSRREPSHERARQRAGPITNEKALTYSLIPFRLAPNHAHLPPVADQVDFARLAADGILDRKAPQQASVPGRQFHLQITQRFPRGFVPKGKLYERSAPFPYPSPVV